MASADLWNEIKLQNKDVLWTPMWNWDVFANDELKENCRVKIRDSISPLIQGLKSEDFSDRNVTEELKAVSALFLMFCAIEGVKDGVDEYFALLGREIPPIPKSETINGADYSVEDPYESDRRLPLELLTLAEKELNRYPVGDQGNKARCRIVWESPIVMDDRCKKIILSVWRNIGFSETHLDIWGNKNCGEWGTQGDNYAFFLRCIYLLGAARLSYERNGRVLPEDVSPQIRPIVGDLNKGKAYFKQVCVNRFLDMKNGFELYAKCLNNDGLSVWAKRGYGEEFELSADDRYDFALKFYVENQSGRQKILGRLPRDVWFFESTQEKDVYKMVPRKGDYRDYTYPIVVAVAPNESNGALIQECEKYLVKQVNVENEVRNFYRYDTSDEFGNSFLSLLPIVPILRRPKRKLFVEYCANGSNEWTPIENVCIDWPHAPRAQCFAAIQCRKDGVFENANMMRDFNHFAVQDFRLNVDYADLQGTKIALLPSGFEIREVYENARLTGVKFFKYGVVGIKPEISKIDGDKGQAMFEMEDGGLMRISFDIQLAAPVQDAVVKDVVNRAEIAKLRSGNTLESIDGLLAAGETPDDDHIVRVVRNGVSLEDLTSLSVRISIDVKKQLLYSSYDNFLWIINHGYRCTDDNMIVAITAFDAAIDVFIYKDAKVSDKVLECALRKRRSLWNDIAQWNFNIPENLKRDFFEKDGFVESFKSPSVQLQRLFVQYKWRNIYKINNPARETLQLAIEKCNNPNDRHKIGAILDQMPDESLGSPETLDSMLGRNEAVSLPYYGPGMILPGIVGSMVQHNKCPDWGTGRVTAVEKSGHLTIRFETGKTITMNWDDFGADPRFYVKFV